jgi:hypothetical protein
MWSQQYETRSYRFPCGSSSRRGGILRNPERATWHFDAATVLKSMRQFVVGVYLGVLVLALLMYLDDLAQRIADLELVHVAKATEPETDA